MDVETSGEGVELVANLVEPLLIPADEVHLVDRQHDVLDTEQGRQERMPTGLLQQAAASIDEDDDQLRGGSAGDHVAGVLDVARGVGDDEFPLGRGEVAVGDVDGDALFALRTQTVGDQCEVGVVITPFAGGALDRGELILHHRLGVVEQPADESGLPVVDGAGGGQSEQGRHQK